MKLLKASSYAILTLPLLFGNAQANPSETKMFGAAAPFTIDKLPVSRLKNKLESLPAPARQKAMKWLHSFNFPEQDIEFLDVDKGGAIVYQDTVLPEEISQADLESTPSLEGINPTDAFKLHSKPGSANIVYLNFKGYTVTGTGWNNGGASSYYAKPFNKDNDINSFSTAERVDISDIWHRIAEDLAPFDIDVTTELPVDNNGDTIFGPKVGHVLITSKQDAAGVPMPYDTAGGVAYVEAWGGANYKFYQPALVYYDNLASSSVYIAEAASHEFGHNLGLSHDGTSTVGYYRGHGTGLTSWAPIMGVGYDMNVTQWSKGDYLDANNGEDDLAIIGGKLNYKNDDHADTLSAATALSVDANGFLASSNPEFDPANQRPDNKGNISNATDVDSFYFETGAGLIDLKVTPAWDAFTRSSHRGANANIQITLYDESGSEIISSNPVDDTEAVISENLAAGRYYLAVTSTANTNFPEYASLGQYYISGIVVPTTADITAPTPDPMTMLNVPAAMSKTSISMTAVEAVDAESAIVEYQFICTMGGAGCTASAWQSEPSYTATGLEADTAYSFQVKARDNSANETALSDAYTATTLVNIAPECNADYEIVDQNTATIIDVLANDTEAEGEALSIYSTTMPAYGEVVIDGDRLIYTPNLDYIGADSFQYTVTDGVGGFASNVVDVDVIEVVAPNAAPNTVNDSVEVLLRSSVTIDVLANDSDPEGAMLNIISVSNASKGTTRVNADGTITYTVSGKNRGGDSFTYTVSDGEVSSTATVTVAIVRRLSGGTDGGTTGGGGKPTKCNPKKGC